MADSSPYTQPHSSFSQFNSQIPPKRFNQGKSYYDIIFKSLFFALLVIVLPLFPSHPPEFINQTMFTNLWELLHLLCIGIAVAYGLFSRRNVEADIELDTHSSIDTTPSYVSRMFPVSSIFGHTCENSCGSDENRMMHCWNSMYFEGVPLPGVVCSNGIGSAVMDEQYKPQLLISGDDFSDSVSYDGNGTNVVQAWNSDYYYSEPVVVVAQPYNTNGECGEVIGYKPLGLPVRSLRPVSSEVDSPKYTNESDSSSGSRGSSKSSDKSRDKEFGDLSPFNLEKNNNDAAGSASPIPWLSRSRRKEREGRHGNFTRPSHFRPLSVDETKFESLSSRSLQSTTSFSSHTSMFSSLDSISSDNMHFQEEDVAQKKTSCDPTSENMHSQEEDMGQTKATYVPPSENMNFQGEDFGKTTSGYSSMHGRMETKGKYTSVSRPSHFRPMSVDETQFEPLSSHSFKSMGSLSSHMNLYSSLDSASSENMNLQKEDLGGKQSSHGFSSSSPSPPARKNKETSLQPFHSRGYSIDSLLQDDLKINLFSSSSSPSRPARRDEETSLQAFHSCGYSIEYSLLQDDLKSNLSFSSSPSPSARRKEETSLQPFHSRGYSIDSLLQDDMKSNLKDDLRGLNRIGGEDPPGNKKSGLQFLHSNSEKSASLAKAPSKGKSVRTRRASGLTSETMRTADIRSKQTDEKVERKPDNDESVLIRKDKMKSRRPDVLLRGISKQNPDAYCPKLEVTFSNHHERDKQEPYKNVSGEDSDMEPEDFNVSSEKFRMSERVNDSGLDSEVDKKASEFIAKFKAQIKLQRMASIERSKGKRTYVNFCSSNSF